MSEQFLGENFILSNDSARRLYFDYARAMPIFDYHCHLSPNQIQENYRFNNLTEILSPSIIVSLGFSVTLP